DPVAVGSTPQCRPTSCAVGRVPAAYEATTAAAVIGGQAVASGTIGRWYGPRPPRRPSLAVAPRVTWPVRWHSQRESANRRPVTAPPPRLQAVAGPVARAGP